jgi:membrane-associated protein
MSDILNIVLHLDQHLATWAAEMGPWLHGLLFAIVFAETGLVITPFLPGDSLLFAVGALAAHPDSNIDPLMAFGVLTSAAILGDAVNYAIGKRIGPRVFSSTSSRLFNRDHLVRAQAFYEKYGGRAIVLARFVPIVRTFAPFVAGIGRMSYRRFAAFNVLGALIWVASLLGAGLAFGEIPLVKNNFELVILGIIVISVLPVVVEWWRARRHARSAPPA